MPIAIIHKQTLFWEMDLTALLTMSQSGMSRGTTDKQVYLIHLRMYARTIC